MKNIQVIDGALNCVYDIYSVSDDDYKIIFPNQQQNIEFIEDLVNRIGERGVVELNKRIWVNRVKKEHVNGIHGTLFYQLSHKKKYYPNKVDK